MEKNTAALNFGAIKIRFFRDFSTSERLSILQKLGGFNDELMAEVTDHSREVILFKRVFAPHPAPQAAAEGVGSIGNDEGFNKRLNALLGAKRVSNVVKNLVRVDELKAELVAYIDSLPAVSQPIGVAVRWPNDHIDFVRGTPKPEALEHWHKSGATVSALCIHRAAPERAAIQPAGELKELMRDVMSWATTYGSLLSGEDWHGMRDKVIDDRLATYFSLSSVTSAPVWTQEMIDQSRAEGAALGATLRTKPLADTTRPAAHSSNAAPSDERDAFVKWLLEVHQLEAEWKDERNCFNEFSAHLAFKAWRVRAALAAPSEHKFTLEELEKIVRYSLAAQRERLAAPAPTGESASVPEGWTAALAEVEQATRKFPTWPTDPLHAVAVLGEEFGELTKAVLQTTYEPHKVKDGELRMEAIQTAAMSLRFLASLDLYEFNRSEQHVQTAAPAAGGPRHD